MAAALKIPEGLTLRISTNAREKTIKILAYRKGKFKYAYKAVLPMCGVELCRNVGPHIIVYRREFTRFISYHQRDVDNLVKKLIKSYS